MKNRFRMGLILMASAFVMGCATNLPKPQSAPVASKMKFREFTAVEMKPAVLNPKDAEYGANQKALVKINELLSQAMAKEFSHFKEVNAFSSGSAGTLQITPVVEDIKFIGGAARFWAGAMAGSSAVRMQVEYKDGRTGNLLANPEFYQDANAWGGAWSMGGSDNMMLDHIVMDIISYTSANQ